MPPRSNDPIPSVCPHNGNSHDRTRTRGYRVAAMDTDEQPEIPPEISPPLASPGMLGRARNLLIDLSPLRESREFRLLWTGDSISDIGSHITAVAIPFQVFNLTHHSSLAVGLLGLCALVPLLTLPLVGGAIADAMDRRTLMLRT